MSITVPGADELAKALQVSGGVIDFNSAPLIGGAPIVASESAQGLIELATQAEVDAGTDTTRAVTPATLKGSKTTSLAASGYSQDDQTGLIVQWGSIAIPAGVGGTAVTFPITFPNNVFQIAIAADGIGTGADNFVYMSSLTTSGCTANRIGLSGGGTFRYIVVGN